MLFRSLIKLDTRRIRDWNSFHSVFAETFGFPDYYGNNMNAWIDCMTCLNDPEVVDTKVKAPRGEVVILQLDHAEEFSQRCPELFAAIMECSAFVNLRQVERGFPAVLALAFHKRA